MSFNGKIKSALLTVSTIACKLPENAGRAFFAGFGILVSKLWIKERARLKDVISRVYFRANKTPPRDIDTIINKMFIHFGLNIYEMMRFPVINHKWLEDRVEFRGLENLEAALEHKNGVILALPHIGNWEVLGAAIAHRGYPLHSFFLAQKEDELGGILDYFRSFSKIILHDRDRGHIKALKALRKGDILGMIADQDGANKGVYMNFLGHWVSMPAGPANWSLRTKAPIVPLFSLRKGMSSHFIARFMPPIYPEKKASHCNDVISLTKTLSTWMEKLILDNPGQYLWFYDRFKPRHEGYISKNKKNAVKMVHGDFWYGG